MKRFILVTDSEKIVFKFPTSFEELNAVYLREVSAHVNVANDYSLVCLVYHEKLGRIIITRKQSKKSFTAGITPVFIKSGNTDSAFIKSIRLKDKLLIPSSSLAIAHHVVCPKNLLSLDTFIKYLDKDYTIASRYNNNYGDEDCYFVEFKIVPNCDIIARYDNIPHSLNHNYVTIIPNDYVDESSSDGDSSNNNNTNNSSSES